MKRNIKCGSSISLYYIPLSYSPLSPTSRSRLIELKRTWVDRLSIVSIGRCVAVSVYYIRSFGILPQERSDEMW